MAKRGHEQPELDYRADGEESLFSQLPLEHTSSAWDDLSTEGTPPPTEEERKSVAEIMAERDARIEERAAKWEELNKANWPESRIQQALDALFPDLRDSDRIEQLAKKNDVGARRQSRSNVKPRPKPPIRYRSPRDKGAPPDIAREIRGY
ncbi:hypothetical protein HYS84_00065 [Candidatus Saccharibacteria bacterium]|nr:hypothetical protein [Candidatus Saccharibacteria bacterium]